MDSNIRRYKRIIKEINQKGTLLADLKSEDFPSKKDLLKMRVKNEKDLEMILPEAFALLKEAAKRVVGLDAFDVQLMGGLAAHEGKIVEMKTGEGKTLTILFPSFLNSLVGKGVHVVTANDYLAERDARWASKIFSFLGVTTGSITSQTSSFDRQVAYAADITYVTNNEVGFDFLRDNMIYDASTKRQRGLHYAIVDEADSVLIDEAQTPLVISDNISSTENERELFRKFNQVVKALEKEIDFNVDNKTKTVTLTIEGINKLERAINVKNLYGDTEEDYLYYIERLLKAHYLFKKDKDYVIDNGEIVIVDEFTGRMMPNHRFFQGIHQAIEAKEEVEIKDETRTLSSITFQNFFKRYKKFAGLTGTAQTSEKEFQMIYNRDIVVIPTNRPVNRQDQPDRFFLTWDDKIRYITWSIQEYFFKQRSVLVGTRSIARSQQIQESLIGENIPSNVLNAKHTTREAEVIAQAGRASMVTVATNMAGRGTDIELDETVKALGGLVVIGSERHNARRIDNQLIGRSGRQGDPGLTQFLISAEDELIRVHFKDEYERTIKKHKNLEQGVQSRTLAKILTKAQQRFESIFFDQRILTYEFDKVLDKQRDSFYRQRQRVLNDADLKEETLVLIKHEIYQLIIRKKPVQSKIVDAETMNKVGQELQQWINNSWLKFDFDLKQNYTFVNALDLFYSAAVNYYQDFENYIGSEKMREIEKIITLKVLDLIWSEHLNQVEELQEASLINSISQGNYFEEYEIQMAKAYRNMLMSLSKVIGLTIFRTVNRLWKNENENLDNSKGN